MASAAARHFTAVLLMAGHASAGRNSPLDDLAPARTEPTGTADCAAWCSPDFAEHCTSLGARRQCELCDFCIARMISPRVVSNTHPRAPRHHARTHSLKPQQASTESLIRSDRGSRSPVPRRCGATAMVAIPQPSPRGYALCDVCRRSVRCASGPRGAVARPSREGSAQDASRARRGALCCTTAAAADGHVRRLV